MIYFHFFQFCFSFGMKPCDCLICSLLLFLICSLLGSIPQTLSSCKLPLQKWKLETFDSIHSLIKHFCINSIDIIIFIPPCVTSRRTVLGRRWTTCTGSHYEGSESFSPHTQMCSSDSCQCSNARWEPPFSISDACSLPFQTSQAQLHLAFWFSHFVLWRGTGSADHSHQTFKREMLAEHTVTGMMDIGCVCRKCVRERERKRKSF